MRDHAPSRSMHRPLRIILLRPPRHLSIHLDKPWSGGGFHHIASRLFYHFVTVGLRFRAGTPRSSTRCGLSKPLNGPYSADESRGLVVRTAGLNELFSCSSQRGPAECGRVPGEFYPRGKLSRSAHTT